jgi:hypothetical protein
LHDEVLENVTRAFGGFPADTAKDTPLMNDDASPDGNVTRLAASEAAVIQQPLTLALSEPIDHAGPTHYPSFIRMKSLRKVG